MTDSAFPSSRLRLMLVDDHLVVRRGLASLLEDEPDLAVVAEAGTGRDAVLEFEAHRPDVVILDLRLPDASGIDVARCLRKAEPEARILILSSFVREEEVRCAFEVGVGGFLPKDASSEDLLRAIREVARGRLHVPAEVSLLLARSASRHTLTDRELEVLRLIAAGWANKEIGDLLKVAENTVKNHVKSILAKLGARDRTHAVTEALRMGWLRLDSGS